MGFLRNLFGKKESAPAISFEEIQSIFQTTLLPLGFEEKIEEAGRMRGSHYLKGNLVVSLTTDVLDSVYFASASSRSEVVNGQLQPIADFSIICDDFKMDKFKIEALAKLNEWLIKQGVR